MNSSGVAAHSEPVLFHGRKDRAADWAAVPLQRENRRIEDHALLKGAKRWVGRYPYIDQPGDQSRKGEYQKPHQTEIVPYERNTEVLSSAIVAKNKTLAVTRLTEPFRLEMKKTHMLRCARIASLRRTVSTP